MQFYQIKSFFRFFHLFISISIASQSVWAVDVHNWQLELGIGANQLFLPSASNVTTASGFPADYYKPLHEQDAVLYLVDVGYRFEFARPLLPVIYTNFEFQTNGANTISGDVKQFSWQWNYNYSYQYVRQSYLFNAQWFLMDKYSFSPYLLTGIGVSRNRLSNYYEQSIDGILERAPLAFPNTFNNQFTYQFGGGISYKFDSHLLLSGQYSFLDAGNISFNPGPIRPEIKGPKQVGQNNLWLFKIGYIV